MKNKHLLALIQASASLPASAKAGAELENLGYELTQKLRGGQAAEQVFDLTVNALCPTPPVNTGCGG